MVSASSASSAFLVRGCGRSVILRVVVGEKKWFPRVQRVLRFVRGCGRSVILRALSGRSFCEFSEFCVPRSWVWSQCDPPGRCRGEVSASSASSAFLVRGCGRSVILRVVVGEKKWFLRVQRVLRFRSWVWSQCDPPGRCWGEEVVSAGSASSAFIVRGCGRSVILRVVVGEKRWFLRVQRVLRSLVRGCGRSVILRVVVGEKKWFLRVQRVLRSSFVGVVAV